MPLLAVLALAALQVPEAPDHGTHEFPPYYPPPESAGGWRALVAPNAVPGPGAQEAIRRRTGVEWSALEQAWQLVASAGGDLLVIRHGWIVGEWGSGGDRSIGSCTKSLTALAMERLYRLSAEGALPVAIDEDHAAWPFLPPVWSAGQPEKQSILLRQLATMTSGLEPHDAPQQTPGYRDLALSLPLVTPPDEEWVYASAPVDLLSFAVESASGRSLADFFRDEVADRLGMGAIDWASMGSSTVASAFCRTSARDLARVAYLLLREGRWDDGTGEVPLLAPERVERLRSFAPEALAARFGMPNFFTNDPAAHMRYGRLFWTANLSTGFLPADLPSSAFYMAGYATNLCVVVPEYDLVVVRLGTGPAPWSDAFFVGLIDAVLGALLDRTTSARVRLGAGGCGPSATPLLFATPPRLGEGLTLGLPAGAPQAAGALFWGVAATDPVPFHDGCSFGIELPPLGQVAWNGSDLALSLPPEPSLAGIELAFQAIFADETASQAIELRLGH